jgi:hypothetical protein
MEKILDLSDVSIFVCSTSIHKDDLSEYMPYLSGIAPFVSGNRIAGHVSIDFNKDKKDAHLVAYIERDCPERLDIESQDAVFFVPFLAIKNGKKVCAFKIESRPFGGLKNPITSGAGI